MAGTLLNILPKRSYDFTSLVSGASETIVFAERVDVSQYPNSVLLVRVHTASCPGGTIDFLVYRDGFMIDDPGTKFFNLVGSFVTINSSTIAPTLLFGAANAFFGHYAAFAVQGTRSAGGSISATISVDLCLRCADDTPASAVHGEYPLPGAAE